MTLPRRIISLVVPTTLEMQFWSLSTVMTLQVTVERLNCEKNKAALAIVAVQLVCLFIKGPYSFSPTEISSCGPHKIQKIKMTILTNQSDWKCSPKLKSKKSKDKNLKYQYLFHTRSVSHMNNQRLFIITKLLILARFNIGTILISLFPVFHIQWSSLKFSL